MADEDSLVALKLRLSQLERTLAALSESMSADQQAALALQKFLSTNRTPQIAGLSTQARYLCAQQIPSESFDLIPTKDGKELWIVLAWTSSFGLSSLLLQALVRLQSEALITGRPDSTPESVFDELTTQLEGALRPGAYRLHVARLNPAKLELRGCSIATRPWFSRKPRGGQWQPMEALATEPLLAAPELLLDAHSSKPTTSANAHKFCLQLNPGQRLFLMGHGWAPQSSLDEWLSLLKNCLTTDSRDLIEDMNALLLLATEENRIQNRESDCTLIAFEISANKLHLA